MPPRIGHDHVERIGEGCREANPASAVVGGPVSKDEWWATTAGAQVMNLQSACGDFMGSPHWFDPWARGMA